MLQNSPNDFSVTIRNAVPAGNTGASRQAPGAASFGKVLAQEIDDKSDVPEDSSAEANSALTTMTATTTATMTAPNPALNNASENENTGVDDSKELKELSDLKDFKDLKESKTIKDLENLENTEGIKDLKDSKDLQDGLAIYGKEAREIKETKTDGTAIAISPRQMARANILHGLITAYAPDSRTGGRTAAITVIPADSPAEVQTDISADAQAEQITTAAQYASLAFLQPGLAQAQPGKAETDADAFTASQSAAAGDPKLWTPGVSAGAAATPAGVKHAVDIRDIHQGFRKEAEIKPEADARRGDSQQTGFHLPEHCPPVETGMSGKSLPEFIPHGSQFLYGEGLHTEGLPTGGLTNTSAMPTVLAAEHGVAPAAPDTGAQATLRLEPRIGTIGWDNALSQKVLWMVSNQLQIAELSLNPPDLGPLQVVLSIINDQASATFVSQHVDVRQALEAALPRLKEMMAESGINLGNTTVSADTPQQHEGHGGFEPQDRPAPRHRGDEETVDMSNAKNADAGIGRFHTSDMGRVGHLGESRLVDTFA